MHDQPEIVEGSERDFGYVVREDGVFLVSVGYTADGEKVKTAEEPVSDPELARRLALQSVYGDSWDPAGEAAFDELAAEHGLGGAAVRLRYPDFDERAAAYDARLDYVAEQEANAA